MSAPCHLGSYWHHNLSLCRCSTESQFLLLFCLLSAFWLVPPFLLDRKWVLFLLVSCELPFLVFTWCFNLFPSLLDRTECPSLFTWRVITCLSVCAQTEVSFPYSLALYWLSDLFPLMCAAGRCPMLPYFCLAACEYPSLFCFLMTLYANTGNS